MRELLRGRLRWLLVAWMFAISATAYLDRVNISIAGPILQKEFDLSNTQLGWVFSAFVIGYALFQVPGGRLVDRYGPRRTLLIATIWWAVFTSLTAMAPSGVAGALLILLSVRLALGLGEAVVYPSSNRLVSKWIPTAERGVANGVIFAGVGIGAGVTPPMVTYILTHYGWHWTFWISALIGLVIGGVWFFIARDEPEQHPWVTAEEVRTIEAGLPVAATTTNAPALRWTQLARSRSVMAMSLSYFTYGYTAYIYFTWFFIYLTKVRGMDLKSSAILGMLLAAGRHRQRFRHAALGTASRPVCSGSGEHGRLRGVPGIWAARGYPANGDCAAGRRSGCAVFLAEFFLVSLGGHLRTIGGRALGIYEHGQSDRRCVNRVADADSGQLLRLVFFVPGRGSVVRSGRSCVVVGRSGAGRRRAGCRVGDDGAVDAGLRRQPAGDGKGHGERQSHQAYSHSGDDVGGESPRVVVAECAE